jgi:hypothetical protein
MALLLTSLRGGMNNTDPAIGLPDDQCILARNVEFVDSMLGERRLGTSAITLPTDLSDRDRVTFLYRHLPTDDETAAELWALGVTGTSTAKLCRKTSSWATVTVSDTPTLTGLSPYRWQAVTLHGKLFLAYDSDVNRLHVVDSTGAMRRSGLAEPAAPTVADTAPGGSFVGTRYYRYRYTEQSGGTTLRRSEPSSATTFSPAGNKTGAIITKGAAISEGETHWEIEASFDNSNFYVLATQVVGTTTYTDTTAYTTGYAGNLELSDDIGDYETIPSARYLTADEDRLVWAGSWENAAFASRVGWTPVFGASGAGNDERFETDTDPYKDLDTYEGGPITGLSAPTLGAIWVFKTKAIFKLVRTGNRASAYAAIKFSNKIGAVHGSVVTGLDPTGAPCVYFIDPDMGPCRIGQGGVKRCGEDIRKTWETLNHDATAVACSALFYPDKKQVHWNIAVSAGNTPTTRLVLHTQLSRDYADGVRKGWTLWTGTPATALSMCLFADNIESNTTRSLSLVPFIALEGGGLVHRCETGANDNGTAYAATITTKPYWMKTLLQQFQVRAAVLCAKAVTSAAVTVKCIRDFGAETTATVSDVSLSDATASDVLVTLDNLKGAELTVAQFQFTDVTTPLARWELNRLDVQDQTEQRI